MPYAYSRKEEAANAITHGLGALLSIAGLVVLIVFASLNGSPLQVVSVSIYGTTMLMMYLSSTILHSLKPGKAKDIFLFIDHSSIYLFIAGTYTPILLVLLRGPIGWTVLGVVWGVAILGIVFKIFFVHRFMVVSTLLYIVLGWFIVFVWRPLSAEMELTGLIYLIIGGILYSVGSIFYMWRGFPYHHAVWHVFVIGGSAFHFFAILFYIVLA
ncbi:PAQR family membrane homeostasis protein TrhA [Alkalibacillus haloalkaliphilus]|uniref:PAQR family membrane homeostasis protein TrhA n=1 Tax=Alkalibacillus haloalkaliphilus TaxID=94136 RepID=UPI0029362177|nr:hemolysin III family protein [Alkalibacillus haloalkaliphilus]MDV2582300.1 hemolysin III family protein [Alkalibacillus haloalkaliphilus]